MKKIKNILIDFDGTIIDPFERLYRLYVDLMRKYYSKLPILSKTSYRCYKRQGLAEKEIVLPVTSRMSFAVYEQQRQVLIETKDYLKFDKVMPRAKKALRLLSSLARLILVSRRKNKHLLESQLQKFALDLFFNDVLHAASGGVSVLQPCNKILIAGSKDKSKEELVKQNIAILTGDSVIIGDTEEDIAVGKKLGLLTVAVTNGLRERAFLKHYQPDYLVKDIFSFTSLLKEISV